MGFFLQILKQKLARFYIRQKLRLKICKQGKGVQPRFVLLNVPSHGNLGDHLIALAEVKFFQDYFNQSPLVFTTGEHEYGFDILNKSISSHDLIFISGGGYLGTEWPSE